MIADPLRPLFRSDSRGKEFAVPFRRFQLQEPTGLTSSTRTDPMSHSSPMPVFDYPIAWNHPKSQIERRPGKKKDLSYRRRQEDIDDKEKLSLFLASPRDRIRSVRIQLGAQRSLAPRKLYISGS